MTDEYRNTEEVKNSVIKHRAAKNLVVGQDCCSITGKNRLDETYPIRDGWFAQREFPKTRNGQTQTHPGKNPQQINGDKSVHTIHKYISWRTLFSSCILLPVLLMEVRFRDALYLTAQGCKRRTLTMSLEYILNP